MSATEHGLRFSKPPRTAEVGLSTVAILLFLAAKYPEGKPCTISQFNRFTGTTTEASRQVKILHAAGLVKASPRYVRIIQPGLTAAQIITAHFSKMINGPTN